MGNSMDTITSPGASARETGSFHARQTTGRTPTSNVSVSAIQPPDTVQQLADAVNSNSEPSVHYDTSATKNLPWIEIRRPRKPNRLLEKITATKLAFHPTVGMVRRCGPRSWVHRTAAGQKRRASCVTVVLQKNVKKYEQRRESNQQSSRFNMQPLLYTK